MLRYEIPGKAQSASNLREHWAVKAKRVKAERATSYRHARANGVQRIGPLLVVTLTRRAPRRLDNSNLGAALKAYIDGIASALRLDDASTLVQFVLRQETGAAAVVVHYRWGALTVPGAIIERAMEREAAAAQLPSLRACDMAIMRQASTSERAAARALRLGSSWRHLLEKGLGLASSAGSAARTSPAAGHR